MSRSWEEIQHLVQARRRADASLVRQMRTAADHYHGDIIIPLPDVIGEPDLPPLMPQLIHDAVESNGMKAAGQTPDLHVPARNPYDDDSVDRAARRRKALHARWYQSQIELLFGRSFRQGVAYGTWHWLVLPCYDKDYERAKIELRNPLSSYPELRDDDEIREPLNVGYVNGRSVEWLLKHFPESSDMVRDQGTQYQDQLWDVCEWIDEDDVVLGLLGPRATLNDPIESFTGAEFYRYENRAGMVPAIAPRRLTLERITGQLGQMVGMVDWMGRLMALEVIAAEKGTFPDLVAFSEEGRPPELAGNRWKDGREGEINVVTGAKDVRVLRTDPGQMTGMVLDRIERAGRFSGGIPAVTGGEFSGSLRSGRVVDTMAAFSIDPRIAELQNIMARALACTNTAIAEVEKGYFSTKKMVAFSGWAGDMGHVEYQPNELFSESMQSVVTYPMPGADISAITVAAAQLSGAGLGSKRSARRLHPLIDDPEAEEVQIEIERLQEAMLVSVQQGATQGSVPYVDLAEIITRRKKGETLEEAIVGAHEAAQERQAAVAPAPGPEGALAPQAVPGLNLPGAGVEAQGVPTVPQARPSLDNLDHLLETLRGGPGGG